MKVVLYFLIFAIALPAFAQVQDAGSSEIRKTFALGRAAAQDIEQRDGVVDNPAVLNYLHRLAARLSPTITIDVRVTRASEEYARLLPNRILYISAAMLARIDSEAALAGLLAHEFAHAQRSAQAIQSSQGTPLHAACALASDIAPLSRLKEVADEERQVMLASIATLERAGFDPLPSIEFFSKLVYEHPLWGNAIRPEDLLEIRATAENHAPPPGGYVIDSSEFANLRAAIGQYRNASR